MSERTLLIIAHLPHASPRIPGLVKYLPEYGWRAIIVSPRLHAGLDPTVRVIETPHPVVLGFWKRLLGLDPEEGFRVQLRRRSAIRSQHSPLDRLLGIVAQVVNYPDAHRHWRRVALRAIGSLVAGEEVTALLSSSSPVSAHVIAREVKARHGVPWIADLRDLWTQNHNYGYGFLRRLIDRKLELRTLQPADGLVTASEPWAKRLQALHKGKVVHAIPNGFDPDDLHPLQSSLTSSFSITYTGNIYPRQGDPSKLFQALQELILDGTIGENEVCVSFYGPIEKWLEKEIVRHGLSSIAVQYGVVPRHVSLEKQRESQLLLLLNWDDQREKGAYSLKAFEYLAARRPILAIGGSNGDVVRDLLKDTQAGMCVSTVGEIKTCIKELFLEYKVKARVDWKGDVMKVDKYSYREMARKFAAILDSLKK